MDCEALIMTTIQFIPYIKVTMVFSQEYTTLDPEADDMGALALKLGQELFLIETKAYCWLLAWDDNDSKLGRISQATITIW